jgi:DNA-binding response OmpR family regulator
VLLAGSDGLAARTTSELAGIVRVIATTDPARVAAIARNESPDFVALDTNTPDLGTWRAISALQADPGTAELRVMLLVRDGELPDALDLGAFHVLAKPLYVERAVKRIRSLAGRDHTRPILIADDDPHVRRILNDALTGPGATVVRAHDVGEASKLVREGVSAAVVDLLLPGRGRGLEVISQLRAHSTEPRPPVMMLIGKEVTPEEMAQLEAALKATAQNGMIGPRPIAQLIREGVSKSPAAPQTSAA